MDQDIYNLIEKIKREQGTLDDYARACAAFKAIINRETAARRNREQEPPTTAQLMALHAIVGGISSILTGNPHSTTNWKSLAVVALMAAEETAKIEQMRDRYNDALREKDQSATEAVRESPLVETFQHG